MQETLKVGKIVTTHGLKGEVKVYPTTENPDRFLELSRVFLDLGVSRKELEIESVRFQNKMVLLKFKGLDRIEDVEGFRSRDLLIRREDAIPLAKNQWFIGDLIGLKVLLPDDAVLGTVKDVMETGANDVLLISTGKKDVMIPVVSEFVKKVSPEEGYIRVEVIPGLLEL